MVLKNTLKALGLIFEFLFESLSGPKEIVREKFWFQKINAKKLNMIKLWRTLLYLKSNLVDYIRTMHNY